MPISPLRMSVMRGAKVGSVKGFEPLKKEVYTLSSKNKVKLGGRVIKGKEVTDRTSDKIKPTDELTGGPAWRRKDQSAAPKTSEPKYKLGGKSTTPKTENKFTLSSNKKKDNGFNALAAGSKSYGQSGRSAPNIGPTSNKSGYAKRDAKLAAAKSTKASYYESSRKAKK